MTRTRRPLQEQDAIAQTALAAISGTLEDHHWSALALCCERDGRAAVAARLGELTARAGPNLQWWDHQLQLRTGCLTPSKSLTLINALLDLEAEGAGPPIDPDRHALGVSAAVRYLQSHLQRVLRGDASATDVVRVAAILREVQRLQD
jgi:hypothetical protein